MNLPTVVGRPDLVHEKPAIVFAANMTLGVSPWRFAGYLQELDIQVPVPDQEIEVGGVALDGQRGRMPVRISRALGRTCEHEEGDEDGKERHTRPSFPPEPEEE